MRPAAAPLSQRSLDSAWSRPHLTPGDWKPAENSLPILTLGAFRKNRSKGDFPSISLTPPPKSPPPCSSCPGKLWRERPGKEETCPLSIVLLFTQHQHLETPWLWLPGAAAPGLFSSVVCASRSQPPLVCWEGRSSRKAALASPTGFEKLWNEGWGPDYLFISCSPSPS